MAYHFTASATEPRRQRVAWQSPATRRRSQGASLETWNYAYDQQNHLVTVEKHATDGGTLQLKVQYKYDALDNRIERTEDSNGDGNVDVTERFGYSQFTLAPAGERAG